MKKKQNKEQFLAVVTLSAIFGLFLFLKMNPESETSIQANNNSKNEVLQVVKSKVEEVVAENNKKVVKVASKLQIQKVEKIVVSSFTDRELKRAQSYLKKSWAPDNTINMAAWNHAKQIKVANNTDIKLATKKPEKNHKVQMVSSSN